MLCIRFQSGGRSPLELRPYLSVVIEKDNIWAISPPEGTPKEIDAPHSGTIFEHIGLPEDARVFTGVKFPPATVVAVRNPDGTWTVNGFDGATFDSLSIADDEELAKAGLLMIRRTLE